MSTYLRLGYGVSTCGAPDFGRSPVAVYMHGSGYAHGDLDTQDMVARKFVDGAKCEQSLTDPAIQQNVPRASSSQVGSHAGDVVAPTAAIVTPGIAVLY